MLQGVGTQAVKVTSVLTTDGPSGSCIIIADETHLYVIRHGTVMLLLPTPDTVTAVCDCPLSVCGVI